MTVFLALLLLIPSFLSAAVFDSNQIGQVIMLKDELEGQGWEGESDGDHTTIYLDGEVMREKTADETGYTLHEPGRTERVVTDGDGQRLSCTVSENGSETVYTYFYEDDVLSSVSVSVDGVLERRIVYLNTPSGNLAGFAGDSSGFILPSYYVYEADGSAIRASEDSGGWEPPADYVLMEDGSWREESEVDGRSVVRIYSPDGRLLSTEGSGVREEYSYDEDGVLLSSVERRGRSSTVRKYEDGRLVSESRFSGPVIENERHFLPDGRIEEIRYSGGTRRNRILFDSDGLRVLEVENFR